MKEKEIFERDYRHEPSLDEIYNILVRAKSYFYDGKYVINDLSLKTNDFLKSNNLDRHEVVKQVLVKVRSEDYRYTLKSNPKYNYENNRMFVFIVGFKGFPLDLYFKIAFSNSDLFVVVSLHEPNGYIPLYFT